MDVRGTPPQCSMIEGVKEKEKSGSVDNEIEDGKIGICVGEEDLKMRREGFDMSIECHWYLWEQRRRESEGRE